MTQYSFAFQGRDIHELQYGSDYISSLKQILTRHLPNGARFVLEWGSGLTTLLFSDLGTSWNTEFFLTIDNHKPYQESVFGKRPIPPFVRMVALDIDGPSTSQRDPELNYSSHPLSLRRKFDLIFIDGRRRVECALIAALVSHPESLVVLHDYRRGRYQAVHALFDILEDGSQFRVMRIRKGMADFLAEGYKRVIDALPQNAGR
jgi:hypothetical protein